MVPTYILKFLILILKAPRHDLGVFS